MRSWRRSLRRHLLFGVTKLNCESKVIFTLGEFVLAVKTFNLFLFAASSGGALLSLASQFFLPLLAGFFCFAGVATSSWEAAGTSAALSLTHI